MTRAYLSWLPIAMTAFGCAAVSTPKVDIGAEERAVRQRTADWFAAERKRDTEASVSFLAPDGIIQAEGAPTIVGVEGLRALYKDFFAQPFTDLIMEPRIVVVAASGDIAYDVGPWKLVNVTKSGRTEEAGKSTIVWKKLNGEWKVAVCAFSMDAPAPPTSAPQSGK